MEPLKDCLKRWDKDADFKVACFRLKLWAALEQIGFQDIRVRTKAYEMPHGIWRFAFRLGSVRPSEEAVVRGVREACQALGYSVSKDLVSAILSKGRVSGLVILKL